MARETKVGLLAGLAFIICFAIILANRGRRDVVTTHQPYVVDHGSRVRNAAGPAARRSAGQRARPATSDRSLRSQPPSALDRTDRPRVARSAAKTPSASGAAVILPTRAGRGARQPSQGPRAKSLPQRVTTGSLGNPANIDNTSPPAGITGSAGNPSSTSPFQTPGWAKRQRALQDRLDTLGGRSGAGRFSSQPSTQTRGFAKTAQRDRRRTKSSASSTKLQRPSQPRQARRYTVVPGDTLSKIAALHLGSASPTVINAIFDANRQVLSSPDVLRVGVELVLPVIHGVPGSSRGGSVAAAPTPVRSTAPQSTKARSTFQKANIQARKPALPLRWYQIKKNDRYITIARRQLGDAGRWREVYELNKDKFPDPQRIREGVRIKLPRTALKGTQP